MDMIGGAATARDLANAAIALEDLPLQRGALLQRLGLPGLDEVRGTRGEAFARGDPASGGLAGGVERERHESCGGPRCPEVEFSPRARMRFLRVLKLATKSDAGGAL